MRSRADGPLANRSRLDGSANHQHSAAGIARPGRSGAGRRRCGQTTRSATTEGLAVGRFPVHVLAAKSVYSPASRGHVAADGRHRWSRYRNGFCGIVPGVCARAISRLVRPERPPGSRGPAENRTCKFAEGSPSSRGVACCPAGADGIDSRLTGEGVCAPQDRRRHAAGTSPQPRRRAKARPRPRSTREIAPPGQAVGNAHGAKATANS